jgi:ferredoxin-nitrite reductase
MNKFEEVKAEKDGLDAWSDIERLAQEGWEAVTDEDKMRMKWFGLFFRKYTPGSFMLRIRIPGGIATAPQLRTLADIARDFGREELHLTTREQVQIRWFRIEHVPEIFDRLHAVGLDPRQTGMDNIRNVMGCPLAGVTGHELLDATPVIQEFTSRFVGNKAFSNLPRKFNVTITGCIDSCVHLETQDIALGPAVKHVDGELVGGFNVLVGGKQGSGGFTAARSLNVFVRPEHAAELCAQIVLIFRDHGSRETRSRARLAFLVDDWGVERFREELERRMEAPLDTAGQEMRGTHHTDHLGVTPQHQHGTYSVGMSVPAGRLTSAQLHGLAELSERFGLAEVRLTGGQNVILPHVPASRLRALLHEPLLEELPSDPSPALRGTVSCTGLGLCDLALADTKGMSLQVAQHIERTVYLDRPISIHWSGCPAACGNHFMADIGLQGGKARVNGEVIQVYQVFAGGRSGPAARPAVPVLDRVPATEITAVVERLARAHAAGRDLVAEGLAIAAQISVPVDEDALVVA